MLKYPYVIVFKYTPVERVAYYNWKLLCKLCGTNNITISDCEKARLKWVKISEKTDMHFRIVCRG